LGLEYDIVKFQRTSNGFAPSDGKKIHPLGLFPIIKDAAITLSESGAIIDYLITTYGADKLSPDSEGWIDNLFFSHYPEGTVMPVLSQKLIFTLVPKRAPFFLRPVVKMIFGMLLNTLVEPRLKLHHDFVYRESLGKVSVRLVCWGRTSHRCGFPNVVRDGIIGYTERQFWTEVTSLS